MEGSLRTVEYDFLTEYEEDLKLGNEEKENTKKATGRKIPYLVDLEKYCALKEAEYLRVLNKDKLLKLEMFICRLKDLAERNSAKITVKYDDEKSRVHLELKATMLVQNPNDGFKLNEILAQLFQNYNDYIITTEEEKYIVMRFLVDVGDEIHVEDHSEEIEFLEKRMKSERRTPGYM